MNDSLGFPLLSKYSTVNMKFFGTEMYKNENKESSIYCPARTYSKLCAQAGTIYECLLKSQVI